MTLYGSNFEEKAIIERHKMVEEEKNEKWSDRENIILKDKICEEWNSEKWRLSVKKIQYEEDKKEYYWRREEEMAVKKKMKIFADIERKSLSSCVLLKLFC